MESYTDFADVYDELMDETPYALWRDRIIDAICQFGISKPDREKEQDALESERNLILDLGCGTGTLTQMLYECGYDLIGVDSSESMLQKAMEKREETGAQILYLNQDMRELEIFSTVGTVISVCDSINYLLELDDIRQTFSLIWNYLYPGGLFIFDFNTDYKYREVIGDATIAENREDCSFIWENFYDPEEKINEYDLTIFVQEKNQLYRKFQETHFQRGYEPDEITAILEELGFTIVRLVDSDSQEAVTETSERIFVVARCEKAAGDANSGV